MATFKVGQRARVIATGDQVTITSGLHQVFFPTVGYADAHDIEIDGFHDDDVPYAARPDWLAPLTDPRCSEFISDMERFSKLKDPVVVLVAMHGEKL
jgi:hypothetical protein